MKSLEFVLLKIKNRNISLALGEYRNHLIKGTPSPPCIAKAIKTFFFNSILILLQTILQYSITKEIFKQNRKLEKIRGEKKKSLELLKFSEVNYSFKKFPNKMVL